MDTQHKYSGSMSNGFWRRVKALKNREAHAAMYSLGVVLQDLEQSVLRQLAAFEMWQNPNPTPKKTKRTE